MKCPFCGANIYPIGKQYACGTHVDQETLPGRSYDCYRRQIANLQADLAQCREQVDAMEIVLSDRWERLEAWRGIKLTIKIEQLNLNPYVYDKLRSLGEL